MWKKTSTIIGAIIITISLIGGVITLDNRYAKSAELQTSEKQTVQTFKQFRTDMKTIMLEDRYFMLSDRILQLKLMLKTYINDINIKEDLERAINERIRIRKKLDKIRE